MVLVGVVLSGVPLLQCSFVKETQADPPGACVLNDERRVFNPFVDFRDIARGNIYHLPTRGLCCQVMMQEFRERQRLREYGRGRKAWKSLCVDNRVLTEVSGRNRRSDKMFREIRTFSLVLLV